MSRPWRKRPSPEEGAEQAGLRAKIYRVQATAFLEPPDEALVRFLAGEYPFLFPEGGATSPDFLRALRVDFTNLFVLSSPPYEAALVGESGHLNSSATDRVTDFYRACGFDPGWRGAGTRHAGVVSMDHLSAELEFLAHLARAEQESWAGENPEKAAEQLALAARFMDEHLLAWTPVYTTAVERDGESDFYRALARWTREFALADRSHIAGLLRAIG